HEAAVAALDRHWIGVLANDQPGDLVRLGGELRQHALAAAIGCYGRRAAAQHDGGRRHADGGEHRGDRELTRLHDRAPLDFTGSFRRGRMSANASTPIATLTGTTPTLIAVIRLLRLSTSRRRANWTSRSSERMASSWARKPSMVFTCSGVSTSLPASAPVAF